MNDEVTNLEVYFNPTRKAPAHILDTIPFTPEDREKYGEVLGRLENTLNERELVKTPDVVHEVNALLYDDKNGLNSADRDFLFRLKWNIFDLAVTHTVWYDKTVHDLIDVDERNESNVQIRERRRSAENWMGGIENWSVEKGVYCTSMLWGNEGQYFFKRQRELIQSGEYFPPEVPGDVEHFLANRVVDLLSDPERKKPVILCDFGGMQGITFLRLARLFKEDILRGRIAMVITNQAAGKEEMGASLYQTWHRSDEWDWICEAYGLVHYIKADAEEIAETEIVIPDANNIHQDKSVRLGGNLSLIHERKAISYHGFMNDIDFPRLADALAVDGCLMTAPNHAPDPTIGRTAFEGYRVDRAVYKSRYLDKKDVAQGKDVYRVHAVASKVAVERLLAKGYALVDEVRVDKKKIPLAYIFYGKNEAPSLRLFDVDGNTYSVGFEKSQL
jgi:hypothetical protein